MLVVWTLAILVVLQTASRSDAPQGLVRTQRIELVDKHGTVRCALDAMDDRVLFALWGSERDRGLCGRGPGLILNRGAGHPGVRTIGAYGRETWLRWTGPDGQPRIDFGGRVDGDPVLHMCDNSGATLYRLPP